jgi:hypothetical protein
MQWLFFGILAMIVVSGVRRMAREGGARGNVEKPAPFPNETKKKTAPKIEAQETVQCPQCQTYVTKGASACGRDGCPQNK